MSDEKLLLILSDPSLGQMLDRAILSPAGYQVTLVTEHSSAELVLKNNLPDLILMSEVLEGQDALPLASSLLEAHPSLPFILLPATHSDSLAIEALRHGFFDYLSPPFTPKEVLHAVERALKRHKLWEEWLRQNTRRDTNSLQQRLNGLEALQRVGRKVTSLLDLDGVLAAVVDAAVELTGAEEGSLLLLDETTGELYVRAGRNFNDDFVRNFRLPIRDTLAGQVLRSGRPVLIDEAVPQKIKTSYLVYTLMYVPLTVQERVIGVLEVDNRQSRNPFTDYHVTLVSALADYAAIAVENARLYSHTEMERNKLETVLTRIAEGVIVIDLEGRVMLINRVARDAFNLGDKNVQGRPIRDILSHAELVELVTEDKQISPSRMEIAVEDGRVLNAQITPIPEVGVAVTMQDITHLKELDRIKSDFVNTVSHDLRSPLTAILGYVELIDRVGPVNEQQREFIRRIQMSVHNITALINDLLDLGRIDAGFDTRMEAVPLSAVIRYSVDGLRGRFIEKQQDLILEVPDNLPDILGNPIRLRQLVTNLVNNANKYTQREGEIFVRAKAEGDQVIMQVSDNGPGIPPADQPYIFDKFYRASNTGNDIPGTGLGLAIVKSIVDTHQGRIWVDSTVGSGTTFTVVLPILERSL